MRMVRYVSPVLLLGAVFFSASFVTVMAHKGASGVVKVRMDAMRALKNELKLIDDMLSGKKYLSKKRLARSLGKVGKHAGGAMIKLFPEGSYMKPSEADPLIWQNWKDFGTLADNLQITTNSFLVSVKGKAPTPTLKSDYLKMRGVCKSCHDRFRL